MCLDLTSLLIESYYWIMDGSFTTQQTVSGGGAVRNYIILFVPTPHDEYVRTRSVRGRNTYTDTHYTKIQHNYSAIFCVLLFLSYVGREYCVEISKKHTHKCHKPTHQQYNSWLPRRPLLLYLYLSPNLPYPLLCSTKLQVFICTFKCHWIWSWWNIFLKLLIKWKHYYYLYMVDKKQKISVKKDNVLWNSWWKALQYATGYICRWIFGFCVDVVLHKRFLLQDHLLWFWGKLVHQCTNG